MKSESSICISTNPLLLAASVMLLVILIPLIAKSQPSPQVKKSDFLKPQPDRSAWRPYGPMTITATSVCVGGQSADIISSTGYEGNSFLRGSDGRMNRGKAIPLKLGICIVPTLFDKKMPKWLRVTMRVVQLTGGGIGMYDAFRNYRNNGSTPPILHHLKK